MEITEPLFNKINTIGAVIVSILSYLLGDHWILFVSFMLLNVGDYVTGYLKSRINKKINSNKGLQGILKKIGYWIMIMVAFGMSAIFIEIGKIIGVNLHITQFIGWFVLSSLIINEFRSIIENFVEAGYNVPKVLVNGLEVANQAIDKVIPEGLGTEDQNEKELSNATNNTN